MTTPDLHDVLRTGSLDDIRAALDAGADVRYVRPKGYTATTDVMFGSPTAADDPQLLEKLQLLIERGADLDAASDYGESALSVAYRQGRFDAAGLLLDAKADPNPLVWTSLHVVVAICSTPYLEHVLRTEGNGGLNEPDRWSRTPWLLSLMVGDIAKSKLLLAAGADLKDRGWGGETPLTEPIRQGNVAMVRWLLAQGIDPNIQAENGMTALMSAAHRDDIELVKVLLDAGADVHLRSYSSAAIGSAQSLPVARMLARAGADFAEISHRVQDQITKFVRTKAIECTAEEYRAGRHRLFGTANPQRMDVPFWRTMVASGKGPYAAREKFEPDVYGPAVWCFARMGSTFTELPDGRAVEIGGEHEDWYDPDFCIYNDVVVHAGDGTFTIYGYPKDVFPPTDFHTATLFEGAIYVVGSLGYRGERKFGTTPVYRLDTTTLAITPIETSGDAPGWISEHKARLDGRRIVVSGGKVLGWADGGETHDDNKDVFALDLDTRVWSKQFP